MTPVGPAAEPRRGDGVRRSRDASRRKKVRVKRDCIHELVLTRGSEEILALNNGIGRSSDLIEAVLQRI